MNRINRRQVVNNRNPNQWQEHPPGAPPEYYAPPAPQAAGPQPEYQTPPAPQQAMPQPEYQAQPVAQQPVPQPEYQAPQAAVPQPEYHAPQPEYYAQPAPQQAVPTAEYYAPQPEQYAQAAAPTEYHAPQPEYYAQPAPQAAVPQPEYHAPQPEYQAPQQEYYAQAAAPQPEYHAPQPEYYAQPAPPAAPYAQAAAPPEYHAPQSEHYAPAAPQPDYYAQPAPQAAVPQPEYAPQLEYHTPQPDYCAPPAPQPYAQQPPQPVQAEYHAPQAEVIPPRPEYHAPQAESLPPQQAAPQPEYYAPQPEIIPPQPEYQAAEAVPAASNEAAPLELDALAYVAAQSPLMSENNQDWQYAHAVYQRAVNAQQQWNGGPEAPQTTWDPASVDTGVDASGNQYQSVDAQEWAASVLDQAVNTKDWQTSAPPTAMPQPEIIPAQPDHYAPPAEAAPPPAYAPQAAVPQPEALPPQPAPQPDYYAPAAPAQPAAQPDYYAPPAPQQAALPADHYAPQAEAAPLPVYAPQSYTPPQAGPEQRWEPQPWLDEPTAAPQPAYHAPAQTAPQPEAEAAPLAPPVPAPQPEYPPAATENTWQAYAQEPQAMTSEWSFLNIEQTVEEQLEQQNSPMKVALLAYTPEPEKVVAAAARLCYSPRSGVELMENFTEEKVQSFLARLSQQGHFSPFEHAVFTFAVDGVSRSLSHQLVRHRLASYSQKSQRYVSENGFHYIVPPSINADPDLKRTFNSLMRRLEQVYDEFIAAGVPPEDARAILPNATTTNLVITMNARSLHNFFRLRCCRRAQSEIRQLANLMLSKVKRVAPNLFATAGATCQTEGICYEGEMSCGLVDVPVRVGRA